MSSHLQNGWVLKWSGKISETSVALQKQRMSSFVPGQSCSAVFFFFLGSSERGFLVFAVHRLERVCSEACFLEGGAVHPGTKKHGDDMAIMKVARNVHLSSRTRRYSPRTWNMTRFGRGISRRGTVGPENVAGNPQGIAVASLRWRECYWR